VQKSIQSTVESIFKELNVFLTTSQLTTLTSLVQSLDVPDMAKADREAKQHNDALMKKSFFYLGHWRRRAPGGPLCVLLCPEAPRHQDLWARSHPRGSLPRHGHCVFCGGDGVCGGRRCRVCVSLLDCGSLPTAGLVQGAPGHSQFHHHSRLLQGRAPLSTRHTGMPSQNYSGRGQPPRHSTRLCEPLPTAFLALTF